MQAIMAYLAAHAMAGAFLGLMAARDAASFYYWSGFSERLPDRPGMFQIAGRSEGLQDHKSRSAPRRPKALVACSPAVEVRAG